LVEKNNNDKYKVVLTVAGDQTKSSERNFAETCFARKLQRSQS